MATRSTKINQKADLIWAIADKLTGVYKPHEYGDVILPLTVIRRFDCILSDTKDAVLKKYDEVKNLPMKDVLLRKASKFDFYNTSKYTFERLMDDPDHIEDNFRDYLNGFSENVQNILEKFKFDGHITTMANKGILYIVLKEYTTDRGNLHPDEISNLEMGYIFEEIIRRFSESHNEDAGQHYTPREVIQLMVNILFNDDNDILSGNNVAKTIYDETVTEMIRCVFRHSVKVYQIQSRYLPSDTEGCAEGFIFCPRIDVLLVEPLSRGVHPISFAHAHNEKSCPVTICQMYRYDGVH